MVQNLLSLAESAETAEKGICFTFLPDIAETASMSGMQSRLILEVSEIRRKEIRGYSMSSACLNESRQRWEVWAREMFLFLSLTMKMNINEGLNDT